MFGFLHDKLGRKPTLLINSVTIVAGLLTLALAPAKFGYSGLIGGVVVSGLAYGGSIPQLAALISAFFGPKNFTTNYAFAALASMVAAILGPYLGSQIMHSYSYKEAIVAAAIVSGISFIMALLVSEPKGGPSAEQ